MATIVEYSPHKRAINAYPTKIVSPTSPGPCCLSSTEQSVRDASWLALEQEPFRCFRS